MTRRTGAAPTGAPSVRFLTARSSSADNNEIRHPLHFCLTLLTLGVWGLVWRYLILRCEGRKSKLLAGFDDDYWSYLLECKQPPASLYRQRFGADDRGHFDA